MPLEQQGHFCCLCNKHVVDLSNMNKQEALEHIKNLPPEPCVAIPTAYLSQSPALKYARFKQVGLAIFAFLAMLVSAKVKAQQQTALFEARLSKTDTTQNTLSVSGKLLDQTTGKPLDYGNINILRNDTIIAKLLSDDEGNFAATIPLSQSAQTDSLAFNVRYIGYQAFTSVSTISRSYNKLSLVFRLRNIEKQIRIVRLIKNVSRFNQSDTEITIKREQISRLPY